MYKRVLLAYDGSLEGRTALREGALLAKVCGAQVYFLSIISDTSSFRVAQGVDPHVTAHRNAVEDEIFQDGIERLKRMGFDPIARMMTGDPAPQIGAFAKDISADLVVVGHHRQNLLSRWWSGHSGAYLVDHIECSLLIGRNVIGDEMLSAELERLTRAAANQHSQES